MPVSKLISPSRLARPLLTAAFLCALAFAAQQSRDAKLTVRILDADTGRPTPVRVLLTNAQGERPRTSGALTTSETAVPIPQGAVAAMWGRQDRAEGYLLQQDGSFYADGELSAELPPGEYTMTLSKGYEYVRQIQTVSLKPGQALSHDIRMERWINMPERGWYSADDHIHIQRSPRDDSAILKWIAAEDVHVGNILEMGDFWATYFSQYSFGEKGRYREGDYILSAGQEEPRTPEIGHTISLGADELVRFRDDYYSYGRYFDRVRELNGIAGFAHQGMSFHAYRGMALNVIRNKVDFLELAQFCVPEGPLPLKHYYHFLNLGFRLTALAGSDFPWCGRGPRFGVDQVGAQIGDARFYTYTGGEFSFDRWLDAVKAGRTFATTGPILELTVNGKLPGETIDVPRGSKLRIQARALGHAEQIPLSELEVVVHGEPVKRVEGGSTNRDELAIEMDLPVEHGLWVAARCKAGPTQQAHTTPVYVTVGGGGFHDPNSARENVALAEDYLKELEADLANPGNRLDDQASRHRAGLAEQIAEARAKLASCCSADAQ